MPVILLVGTALAAVPAYLPLSPARPPPASDSPSAPGLSSPAASLPEPGPPPTPPPFQIESLRFRLSYFDQNGLGYQSAAGPPGEPGSERVVVAQPQVEVAASLGDHVTQRLWVPVDVITAASPDHSRYGKPIDAPDAITTASAINEAATLDAQTDYHWRP